MKSYLIFGFIALLSYQNLCEMACLDKGCCDPAERAFFDKYNSFSSDNSAKEDFYEDFFKEELDDLIDCKCSVELNEIKECLNQDEYSCFDVLNKYRVCKARELTNLNLHSFERNPVNCCVKCSSYLPAQKVFSDQDLKNPDYPVKVVGWRNAQDGGCLEHEDDEGCVYQWGPCS